jgi:hypothetical protein
MKKSYSINRWLMEFVRDSFVIISAIIFIIFMYNKFVEKETPIQTTAPYSTVQNYHINHIHSRERRVNLNDYLNSVDSETDWNNTDIGDEEMKILKDHHIRFNYKKGYWVKY